MASAEESQDNGGTIPETQFSNPYQQPPPEMPDGDAEPDRNVSKTPESQQPQNPLKPQQQDTEQSPATPPSPDMPSTYDWDDYERRFEEALKDADEKEKDIMKEADGLAQYFRAWAAAASAHDDERAAKRIQTRRRYVNMREDELDEKQKHYDEVVQAFESALALMQRCICLNTFLDSFGQLLGHHVTKCYCGGPAIWFRPHANLERFIIHVASRTMSKEVDESNAKHTEKQSCGAPQVSNDELSVFYQAHFGDAAIAQFGQTFLNPAAGAQSDDGLEQWEEEEEEDLGYYDDGVKRTLTDDQIAMFRHSELKELRRKEEKAALKKHRHLEEDGGVRSDDDEAPLEESSLPSRFTSTKKKRKKNHAPKEPKPDLRKRTWDVVEKGLDTLDYD